MSRQITGSDIEKKKLTKKFEQIAGPELSKYASTKNMDKLERLACSDPKKTEQMLDDLWPKIEKEGNVTRHQFAECWVKTILEMAYEAECVRKDEGHRQIETIQSRCMQDLNNENCTEISKKMISNPEKAAEIACASKSTFMEFAQDYSCPAGESETFKVVKCMMSSIKK